MKITKTKEIITEEVQIKTGTYYFEDENIIAYKFVLHEPEEDYSEYELETLQSYANLNSIKIKEDGAWDENDLPYVFKQFILGISGKEILKEDYYKERQQILEKLCK